MVRVASIRFAEVRDAAAIAQVHVESWLTTYEGIVPRAYLATLNEAERVPLWEDWLTRDVSVFVAELDGDVVGFSGAGAIREPFADYDAELYTLYLLEGAQGRGIGRALLGAVTEAVVGKAYKSMLVWVLGESGCSLLREGRGATSSTQAD